MKVTKNVSFLWNSYGQKTHLPIQYSLVFHSLSHCVCIYIRLFRRWAFKCNLLNDRDQKVCVFGLFQFFSYFFLPSQFAIKCNSFVLILLWGVWRLFIHISYVTVMCLVLGTWCLVLNLNGIFSESYAPPKIYMENGL